MGYSLVLSFSQYKPLNRHTAKALLDAYRKARYEFKTDAGWLAVRAGDEACTGHRWLSERYREYVFITAFNPASVALCEAENLSRHEDLGRALAVRGWRHVEARGVDVNGKWQAEAGYLVLDAPRAEVLALARELDQNAVLAGGRDTAAQVVAVNPDFAAAQSEPDGGVEDGLWVYGLGFAREDDWIFRGLTFHVPRGGCLVVEGGNGSGKTTLLRVLAGLLEQDEGRVEWAAPARITYLGHKLALKEDLTSEENLRWINALFDIPANSYEHDLARCGLNGYQHTVARHLSAGQRKRLALTRLLHDRARLWLLDEPYANLDRDGVAMLTGVIRAHLEGGGLALITSHGGISPALPGLSQLQLDA